MRRAGPVLFGLSVICALAAVGAIYISMLTATAAGHGDDMLARKIAIIALVVASVAWITSFGGAFGAIAGYRQKHKIVWWMIPAVLWSIGVTVAGTFAILLGNS